MSALMKAVVKTKPAVGAELTEIPVPAVGEDEVMLKVKATSLCGTDVHIYKWDEWSSHRIGAGRLPQTLGHEVAGEVMEVGRNVRRVKSGDLVSAETHIFHPDDLQSVLGQLHIGERMQILGVDRDGCFADYVVIPERVCWVNAPSIPPEYACIQEPLGNATYAVLGEDGDVAGKTMLITGDGPVSLFAIAVARACGVGLIIHFGFWDFNVELGGRLGADHQFFTSRTTAAVRRQAVMDLTGGYGVDIALEMVGTPDSVADCFALVRKGGRISAFGLPTSSPIPIDYINGIVFKGVTIYGINGRKVFDTWYRNRNLLANGRLNIKPVVTDLMALEEFDAAFARMTAEPRRSAKVVMFPDRAELDAALKRRVG